MSDWVDEFSGRKVVLTLPQRGVLTVYAKVAGGPARPGPSVIAALCRFEPLVATWRSYATRVTAHRSVDNARLHRCDSSA